MGKNVGLTYGEFTFPAEQGFTGSAGVHQVKGYQRGGSVKGFPCGGRVKGKSRAGFPSTVKAKGGPVKKNMGGSVGLGRMGGNLGQDREISVDDVRISVPKKHGGKMSVHDKLYHEGGKMGYAYGGQVKPSNTSGEFKMTKGRQDTMDTGNQPARRGRNQAEIEAGGTKRLKPGLSHGGKVGKGLKKGVHVVRAMGLRKRAKPDISKALKASKKGIPKNVKARGGLMEYAGGGVVKKAGAAL